MSSPVGSEFVGPSLERPDERQQLLRDFRLIIRLRFLLFPAVTALIVLASLVGLARQSFLDAGTLLVHGVNAAVVLGLNAAALALARRVRNIAPLVLLQLAIDVLNFTFTIYKTGGAASPLVFLYYGVLFAAAILAGTRATFAMAAFSALLYVGVVSLEAAGVLPHQAYFLPLESAPHTPAYLVLAIGFTLFSLALIAFLASYLAAELRKRHRSVRQANEELKRRVATLSLLYRTTEALNSFSKVREVADYILGELLGFLSLDRALLYLAEGGKLRLAMVRHRGRSPKGRAELRVTIPLRLDAGLTARAALERRSYNVQDPNEMPGINRALARRIGTHPFALVPLVTRDRLVGVLGVDRGASRGFIDSDEFRFLEAFAGQAAIAIASLKPRRP